MATERIKQVVDAATVSHLWAHQTQDHARTPGSGNYYFNGPDIYSYGSHFRIATQIDIPDEIRPRIASAFGGIESRSDFDARVLVLFTTRTYSNTTAKHISLTRSAVSHLPVLEMPVFVEELEAPTEQWALASWNCKHEENLTYFLREAKEAKGNAERARADWKIRGYVGQVHANVAAMKRYMQVYGIYTDNSGKQGIETEPVQFSFFRNEMIELSTYERVRVEKPVDPKTAEKREKARAARERAKGKEAEKFKDQWLAGEDRGGNDWNWKNRQNRLNRITDTFGVLLRLTNVGEIEFVETTKQAKVPADDAKALLHLVRLVKETGRMFDNRVHAGKVTVGHYVVSRITEDGDLIVGCHTILNSELERFATEQGWEDATVTIEKLLE